MATQRIAAKRLFSGVANVSPELLLSAIIGHEVGGTCQQTLVDSLLRTNLILKGSNIETVLRRVDRAHFAPENVSKQDVYKNRPIPIGKIATMSTPQHHAQILCALEPHLKPGASALDLGCGTGYLSVCMAQLVGTTGNVVGIDIVPNLVQKSSYIAQTFFDSDSDLQFVNSNGQASFSSNTFDCIHIGYALPTKTSGQDFLPLLKPGGGLLLPIGLQGQEQLLLKMTKSICGKHISEQEIMRVFCQPMLKEAPEETFTQKERLVQIEEKLHTWRINFETIHNRKPTRSDLYANVAINHLYEEYRMLRH